MENEGLVELFEYNNWANRTLLEACRAAPDGLLDTRVPGVSGTVRSLLTHLVGGQHTFLLRTQGRQHEGEWGRSSAFPGFDELLRVAEETGAGLLETARDLSAGAKVTLPPCQGQVLAFPVSFFLMHALEHAVEPGRKLRSRWRRRVSKRPTSMAGGTQWRAGMARSWRRGLAASRARGLGGPQVRTAVSCR